MALEQDNLPSSVYLYEYTEIHLLNYIYKYSILVYLHKEYKLQTKTK